MDYQLFKTKVKALNLIFNWFIRTLFVISTAESLKALKRYAICRKNEMNPTTSDRCPPAKDLELLKD
jgi:hypothetical protein